MCWEVNGARHYTSLARRFAHLFRINILIVEERFCLRHRQIRACAPGNAFPYGAKILRWKPRKREKYDNLVADTTFFFACLYSHSYSVHWLWDANPGSRDLWDRYFQMCELFKYQSQFKSKLQGKPWTPWLMWKQPMSEYMVLAPPMFPTCPLLSKPSGWHLASIFVFHMITALGSTLLSFQQKFQSPDLLSFRQTELFRENVSQILLLSTSESFSDFLFHSAPKIKIWIYSSGL